MAIWLAVQSWDDGVVSVAIPYSIAGVATTIVVRSPAGMVLVDCGDGALRDLLEMEVDLAALRGVILTHHHYDHIGGLYTLLGALRTLGRQGAVAIHYPQGATIIEEYLGHFSDGTHQLAYPLEMRPSAPGETFTIAGFTVTPVPAVHRGSVLAPDGEGTLVQDLLPAWSPVLEHAGKRLVFSGDTGLNADLHGAVAEADLAVLECTFKHFDAAMAEVHLSEEEAIRLAHTARSHLLIHRRYHRRPEVD